MQLFSIEPDPHDCFSHTESGKRLPINAGDFRKVFIVNYYPDAKRRSKNRLIGFTTMIKLLGNRSPVTFLQMVLANKEQRAYYNLYGAHGGSMLSFYRRKPRPQECIDLDKEI